MKPTNTINLTQLVATTINTSNAIIGVVDTTVSIATNFADRQRDKSDAKQKAWDLAGKTAYEAEVYAQSALQLKEIQDLLSSEPSINNSVVDMLEGKKLSLKRIEE